MPDTTSHPARENSERRLTASGGAGPAPDLREPSSTSGPPPTAGARPRGSGDHPRTPPPSGPREAPGPGRRRADAAPTEPPGAPGDRETPLAGRVPRENGAGDARSRHRLVRLAVLPAAAVLLVGAAAVTVLVYLGGVALTGPRALPVGVALATALLLASLIMIGAGRTAAAQAAWTAERCTALRRGTMRGQAELRALRRGLEQGEAPRVTPPPAAPGPAADSLDLLGHELALAQRTAEIALVEAVRLARAGAEECEEKVEVFGNLARRLQSLVHGEIELLDELECDSEDPALVKSLFAIDHLATRTRRHAENIAVLGGSPSRRQWTRPIAMVEVLRAAVSEVEQYPRVKLTLPVEGTLRGHAVADVVHLLAELIENATVYSGPRTEVLLRAQYVTAGLAIEVEDRGLGMTRAEQDRMNAVLNGSARREVARLLHDGRIGMFLVASLARRHDLVVQLRGNIYGGVQAVLVVPPSLLGAEPESREPGAAEGGSRYQPALLAGPHAHPEGQPADESEPFTTGGAAARSAPAAGARHAVRPLGSRASGRPPAMDSSTLPGLRAPAPVDAVRSGAVQHALAADGGDRPRLPKRRRQEHLVTELREPARQAAQEDPEETHDPGLMAAFRTGISRAEREVGPERSAETERGRPAERLPYSVAEEHEHGTHPVR
ncbi:ATP-binding protein [Streptomyces sp. AJS327]|uniref:sensor histidine kinase n=1 Tax=Streptomyces sp. AJS327 TaxID=2545265 RepID=UPI0015DF01F5|nr:ATP-binding protein [Streptomyces sp. AJS327]MBA0052296.1 ATP-binding protein [Streptomyces sp. AJS327]